MEQGDSPVEEGSSASSPERDGPMAGESISKSSIRSMPRVNKFDTFDVEAGRNSLGHNEGLSWVMITKLAVQSIGVVYGDLGTSPLYVLPGIFPNGIKDNEDILGALSLIFYAIVIIFMLKYVWIVLSANDHGDGGTFALYSLICRYAKTSLIPNQQKEDREISNYRLQLPDRRQKRASMVKSWLENSIQAKYFLLFTTMLGTSMVIGDGILTPCISVLSAVGGIKMAASSLTDNTVMWISVGILVFLFSIQRFGTHRVGYTFAPILSLWFVSIALIGIFNFVNHDPGVIKAVNPAYIIAYFKRNHKEAWISLGGVILCLTGSEALFADLGHFYIRSIQISSCGLVFPAIVLAYFGQASYLRKHPEGVSTAFYSSMPKPVYWPMFVLAVLAAIIASQSLISAAFAIVKQSVALGCFPRVKVIHTSNKVEGQIYIPEINAFLMVACVGVTLGFKNTLQMGNAYGIAVGSVFVITSFFLIIVMIMIWKTRIIYILAYIMTIGVIELAFLSSVLYKFMDGGFLPLIFSFLMVIVMFVWFYGYRKKYYYELDNKVSADELIKVASSTNIRRVPGLALLYSELVPGITPMFTHYVANVPALHSVLVFVTIKSLPISHVSLQERFLFVRLEPHDLAIYRCVVRYGYRDVGMEHGVFEGLLVSQLKEFIEKVELDFDRHPTKAEPGDQDGIRRDRGLVDDALKNGGITYLMGESELVAVKGSTLADRVMINCLFAWLKSFVRQQDQVFMIPRKRLLKVGVTYEIS
ncbi:potassium transporter 19-like [Punica granatum]|uniref:Potassium transporter n=2 Tax=Punica granatum TaxID=22663 RepID=A0A6P8CNJ5_PUNGR|nr:potassium transporter 19-like [Punica granatum]